MTPLTADTSSQTRLTPDRTAAPVRILQLTDTHFPSQDGELMQGVDTIARFDALADAILGSQQHYDLLLLTGDLVHEPSTSAYRSLRSRLQTFWPETPCYALPGNHDDRTMLQTGLGGANIRPDTCIECNDWRIVLLDSSVPGEDGGFLAESQFKRLNDAIEMTPQKHLLVAVHHHPIPCGSLWMDTMVIPNGSRLLDALTGLPRRASAVVFGHIHQSFDRMIDGVRLLGTPATCIQFKPYSREFALDDLPPGYRRIDLYPDGSLETEVVYLAPS